MRDKPLLLSLVVRFRPDSSVFEEALRETLESVFSHAACRESTRVLLVAERQTKSDEWAPGVLAAAHGVPVDLCTKDEVFLHIEDSEYVMVLHQGDVFEDASAVQLFETLASGEAGIVSVRSQKEATNLSAEFLSAYVSPFRALTNLNGVALKTAHVCDAESLFSTGLAASAMLIKAVMAEGGYLRERRVLLTPGPHRPKHDSTLREGFVEDLSAYCMREFGELPEYVQHCIAGIIQSTVDAHGSKELVERYVGCVDDEIILKHSGYNLHGKIYILGIKHHTNVLDEIVVEDDGSASFRDNPLFKINSPSRFRISVTNIEDGFLVFEGTTDLEMLGDGYELFVSDKFGTQIPLEIVDFHVRDEYGLDGELTFAGRRFKVRLPLRAGETYEFVLRDAQQRDFRIVPQLLRHSRLDPKNPNCYFVSGEHIVKLRGPVFSIDEYVPRERAKLEAKGLAHLVWTRRPAIAAYRLMHFAHERFKKKPVWIIADRPHAAKDNGEHMYRYLLQQDAARENDIYFLISKESPDYERIKKMGKALKYDSLSHKLKFLEADIIISAAANNLATNAFGKSEPCYRDLYDFDFVYLRHGVSHNDQSHWINKLNKNMRILVSTSKPEYKGILAGDYGYTEREVKLTGLPRYDNLTSDRQKVISILPTWRKNLEGKKLPRSSQRDYIVDFKDSDYFKFYDALIHDERLLAQMRKRGFRGVFYLHPVFEAQYADFTSSELIEVGNGVADYQTVFRESDVMVTDFSSVAFDFAYLKKPVIYSQFDEDTFYENHSWGKGYFSYRENGFGPITTTLDETVDALISCMENDCQMEQRYIDRVEAFFAYTDRNNCKRVYEAIQEIERDK